MIKSNTNILQLAMNLPRYKRYSIHLNRIIAVIDRRFISNFILEAIVSDHGVSHFNLDIICSVQKSSWIHQTRSLDLGLVMYFTGLDVSLSDYINFSGCTVSFLIEFDYRPRVFSFSHTAHT